MNIKKLMNVDIIGTMISRSWKCITIFHGLKNDNFDIWIVDIYVNIIRKVCEQENISE